MINIGLWARLAVPAVSVGLCLWLFRQAGWPWYLAAPAAALVGSAAAVAALAAVAGLCRSARCRGTDFAGGLETVGDVAAVYLVFAALSCEVLVVLHLGPAVISVWVACWLANVVLKVWLDVRSGLREWPPDPQQIDDMAFTAVLTFMFWPLLVVTNLVQLYALRRLKGKL